MTKTTRRDLSKTLAYFGLVLSYAFLIPFVLIGVLHSLTITTADTTFIDAWLMTGAAGIVCMFSAVILGLSTVRKPGIGGAK